MPDRAVAEPASRPASSGSNEGDNVSSSRRYAAGSRGRRREFGGHRSHAEVEEPEPVSGERLVVQLREVAAPVPEFGDRDEHHLGVVGGSMLLGEHPEVVANPCEPAVPLLGAVDGSPRASRAEVLALEFVGGAAWQLRRHLLQFGEIQRCASADAPEESVATDAVEWEPQSVEHRPERLVDQVRVHLPEQRRQDAGKHLADPGSRQIGVGVR